MDFEENLIKEYNQLKHREDINSGQHKKNILVQGFSIFSLIQKKGTRQ